MCIAEESVPKTKRACQGMLDRLSNVMGVRSQRTAAILILTRAASEKPTYIHPIIIKEVACFLTPSEISETFMWLGILISFHRILRFYDVKENTPSNIWDDNAKLLPRTPMQSLEKIAENK